MDDQTLVRTFAETLGADNAIRRVAEQFLAQLEGSEGLYPRLCKLALSDNPPEISLAAVLFLKNSCKYWKEGKRKKMGKPPVPEADKQFLRVHITTFLLPSIPEKIRLQFEEIAKSMAENLFPQQWPEVYALLDATVLADNRDQLFAGLTLLHQLAKTFEYNTTEHRSNLPTLTCKYFPHLLQCLLQLPLEEANFPCLVLILKSYYAATYIDYSEDLEAVGCFDLWIGRMKELLEISLGVLENIPPTPEDAKRLEDHPAWICKRVCAQIVQRCFQRETNLHYLSDQVKQLTSHFCQKFSLALVQVSLRLLLNRTTHWVPDAVTNYLWKYIAQGAKSESTKAVVQSQIIPLLSNVLLSHVCRVPYDQELWEHDAVEFIRKENDMAQAFHSAKSSAVDFLITICTEATVLNQVLMFLYEQFKAWPIPLIKEALLLLFGSLAELVSRQGHLNHSIESSLQQFVFPDLENPSGFLKSRAVWVYGMFASIPMESTQNQESVIRKVCQLLVDRDLPVRIEAAITLSKILGWQCAKAIIEPEIKNLLDVYLSIMDQIDSEELMDSMETLVGFFSEAVVPYSVALAQKLTEAFSRMASSGAKNDEGAAAMAAVSTLNILIKLLEAVREHKEQLAMMSHVVLPILDYTLSSKGDDFFEEGLSLLSDLLYYPEANSLPHLFSVFPRLLEALIGAPNITPYASDHIELMYVPLANFISKYKEMFLAADGINQILSVASKLLLLDEDSIGYEYHLAIKLLLCLIENYPSHLQTQVSNLNMIVLRLIAKKQKAMTLLGVELFAMVCCINPTTAIETLQGHHEAVIGSWFKNYSKFTTETGKLHSAAGMLRLLAAFVAEGRHSPQDLKEMLKHLMSTMKDIQMMKANEEEEDDVTDLIKKLKVKTDQEKEEDDDDDDWSPIDEDLYDSPLELDSMMETLKLVVQQMQVSGILTEADMATLLAFWSGR